MYYNHGIIPQFHTNRRKQVLLLSAERIARRQNRASARRRSTNDPKRSSERVGTLRGLDHFHLQTRDPFYQRSKSQTHHDKMYGHSAMFKGQSTSVCFPRTSNKPLVPSPCTVSSLS